MEVTHFAFAQCTMNAALADPRVLYGDPDGHIAVLLSPLSEYGSVSLVGTAAELHALADTLRAIVTAHESQTTLAGEAAREAAWKAECNAARQAMIDKWGIGKVGEASDFRPSMIMADDPAAKYLS